MLILKFYKKSPLIQRVTTIFFQNKELKILKWYKYLLKNKSSNVCKIKHTHYSTTTFCWSIAWRRMKQVETSFANLLSGAFACNCCSTWNRVEMWRANCILTLTKKIVQCQTISWITQIWGIFLLRNY